MHLPVTGGALAQETVAAQPTAASGVEKKPPNGGVAEEIKKAVKDAQPISPFAPLAV